jgi:hypothetical protein
MEARRGPDRRLQLQVVEVERRDDERREGDQRRGDDRRLGERRVIADRRMTAFA